MVKDFIQAYANLIVQYPNELKVESRDLDEAFQEIVIYAHPDDVGKLIGKEGRMINALKTVISGCKAKGGKTYRVTVKSVS